MKQYSSHHWAGGFRALTRFVFSLLMGLSALGWLTTSASAITRYWTHDNSQFWSDPNNWNPSGVPQNGDDLYFDDTAIISTPRPMTNNLNNLVVSSLSFIIDLETGTSTYMLSGNPLIISNVTGSAAINNTGGLVTGLPCNVHIDCALTLATDAIFQTGSPAADFVGTTDPNQLFLDGSIDLGGHNLTLKALTFSPGDLDPRPGNLFVSGGISGNGNVTAICDNDSALVFRGTTNSFRGALTLDAHTGSKILLDVNSGVVVTDSLLVKNAGLVRLIQPDQIGDYAAVTITDGATLSMGGNSDTIGSLSLINVSADAQSSTLDTGTGTLTVNGDINASCNNNDHTPIIRGRLSLAPGSHAITTSGSAYAGLDMQAEVTGFGNFQKLGNSALLLEANNTFDGSISILSGILDVRNSQALGDVAGDTSLFGGSLTLRNVNIGTERLSAEGQGIGGAVFGSLLTAIGSCSWAGQVLLDTNLVVIGRDMTFTGDISGSGGIGFLNQGTSVLGGLLGNTYTGTTLVRCPLLEFNKPSGINAYAGPLEVGGGAGGPYEARWLNSYQNVGGALTLHADGIVKLNNHNEDFGSVTFNGGAVDTGTGQFAIYAPLTVNPSPSSAVINGYLGLPPGADRVFIVGDGVADPDLLVNAVVFGNPGTYFVKQGAGTLALANANTYNAPTLLEQGILDINSDGGLGTWPGLIIFDGATLRISGSGTTGGGVELLGTGVGGTHGAIEVLPGNFFSTSGGILLDGPTTFNIGALGALGFSGSIVGTGPLTKIGQGFINFTGAGNNAYSGDTIVVAGAMNLSKNPNVIAVPHNLVVGPAFIQSPAVARFFQAGGLGGTVVTINANSLLDLNGYYQSLTTLNLRDGGSVQTRAGLLDFPNGGAINVGSVNALIGSHMSASIMGAIGLPANATLSFNINSYAPFPPFASGPELDVLAAIPRPVEDLGFAPAGITKNGFGQMRLSANNTYAGSTFINGGTLLVDGTQPQSLVAVNSGTLGGSGTVGDIYMTGSSAVVAPGDNGPGILTCGNLNAGITANGVLRMELNGTTPGSGYDQLNVRGTVNLAGVTLQRPLGFSPPTGAQFDIISNDGRDFVTGAFNGLPDGGKLYIGGVIYQINYGFGGRPGNDVALQGLDTPPPPTLIIQRLPPASVRLLWPVSDPPFNLQTCTNLDTASWTPALPLPTVSGTNNIVSNPASNTQQFYRLISP
jgi:autotransporter-associated beta strand protein